MAVKLWAALAVALLFASAVCVRADDLDDHGDQEQQDEPVVDKVYTVPEPSTYVFYETFQSDDWNKRWIESAQPDFDGDWSVSEGDLDWGLQGEKGLVLETPARRHAISAKLPAALNVTGKTFVVQYEVRFHKRLECGGAYLKLLRYDPNFSQKHFDSSSDYTIMFGPDKCGATNKVHFIFKHKNPITGKYEEKHLDNPPKIKNDQSTHVYTLVVRPDNTYEIFIDTKSEKKGSLLTDFVPPVNPPKMIDDPEDKKPEDWEDEEFIPDPTATKPDDWDENEPKTIPDPDATKPEGWLDDAPAMIPDPKAAKPSDWDEELDGDWEAPLIENPACVEIGCGEWKPPTIRNPKYKGKWEPPMIDNPKYKGKWTPKQIPNPNYFEDKYPSKLSLIGAIGFELWTMQDQIQFDNIYIGQSAKAAIEWAKETWGAKNKVEKEHEKKVEKESREDGGEGFMYELEKFLEPVAEFIQQNSIAVFVTVIVTMITIFIFFGRGGKDEKPEEEEEEEEAETKEDTKKSPSKKKTDDDDDDDADKKAPRSPSRPSKTPKKAKEEEETSPYDD